MIWLGQKTEEPLLQLINIYNKLNFALILLLFFINMKL